MLQYLSICSFSQQDLSYNAWPMRNGVYLTENWVTYLAEWPRGSRCPSSPHGHPCSALSHKSADNGITMGLLIAVGNLFSPKPSIKDGKMGDWRDLNSGRRDMQAATLCGTCLEGAVCPSTQKRTYSKAEGVGMRNKLQGKLGVERQVLVSLVKKRKTRTQKRGLQNVSDKGFLEL